MDDPLKQILLYTTVSLDFILNLQIVTLVCCQFLYLFMLGPSHFVKFHVIYFWHFGQLYLFQTTGVEENTRMLKMEYTDRG